MSVSNGLAGKRKGRRGSRIYYYWHETVGAYTYADTNVTLELGEGWPVLSSSPNLTLCAPEVARPLHDEHDGREDADRRMV